MVGGIERRLCQGAALPRPDGQGRHPRRRGGRGPGGEDLQQHAARRDDGGDLRGVRAGAEARARPAEVLRHFVQGLGPELVDDQLLPRPRCRPRDPRRPQLRRRVRRRADAQGPQAGDGSRGRGRRLHPDGRRGRGALPALRRPRRREQGFLRADQDDRRQLGSRRSRATSRLDRKHQRGHMPLMLIETERTPNPATRKFLPGRT